MSTRRKALLVVLGIVALYLIAVILTTPMILITGPCILLAVVLAAMYFAWPKTARS
jgi:hypothetical protein